MSAIPQEPLRMTQEEYLAFDRMSKNRHEYFGGYIIAMAGASREHNLITGNSYASLHAQLRKQACEVYQSEMRVHIQKSQSYSYPDITVVCGEPWFIDTNLDTLTNPTLLIEVLSPSTEKLDREVKSKHYRNIPSLQEYLLIAQNEVHVEHYKRNPDKSWQLKDYQMLEDVIELTSIHCHLALADVYEKIDFEGKE